MMALFNVWKLILVTSFITCQTMGLHSCKDGEVACQPANSKIEFEQCIPKDLKYVLRNYNYYKQLTNNKSIKCQLFVGFLLTEMKFTFIAEKEKYLV